MMTSKANVVLMHGAFADGSSWSKVITLLRAKGVDSVAVQNPLTSLADDVAATERVLDYLDGPVILAGHSWGGAVITAEEAKVVYATQGPLAARCFDDNNRGAAWRNKPSWYIVAEEDRMIAPGVERDSAARMKANTVSLASSHVPMLSQPERVAEIIIKAVESIESSAKPTHALV